MANTFDFTVVLEPQAEGGFTVSVPALPEVVTEGDDEAEAMAMAEEAIRAVSAIPTLLRDRRFRVTPPLCQVTRKSAPWNWATKRQVLDHTYKPLISTDRQHWRLAMLQGRGSTLLWRCHRVRIGH